MVSTLGIYEPTNRKTITNTIGWKILCEQEKTPFIVTSQPDCPVMVFDGNTPDWFAQYMTDGGIGIVTDCHPDFLPFEVEYVGDASIENVDLTELGSTFARVQCLAQLYRGVGYGKIRIHEKRVSKTGMTQDEFPVFLFAGYGMGGCFFTGLPIAKLITALGDTLRATTSFSNFSERIVSIDKHHLLKAMREILIMAFHKRELPYVHLGYFPDDYQSALAFRIDVDGVFGENLINISKSALENGFSLTIFANKSLCEDNEEFIRKIDPAHEIGNHADVHNLFADYESNLRNIQECKNWLNHLGVEDNKLFSAPRGMWNYALHQALHDLGYLYTSDFGAAIGGFPFFPYVNGMRSGTLQIPVNPFSAERAAIWRLEAEKQQISAEYVAETYIKIIEENYHQSYPIILYSHPEKFGLMAEYVFQEINKKIESMNLWKTTLTHFANWWLKRDKINYCVEYDLSTKKTIIKGDIDDSVSIKEI
jgi:peptidoglycan/xylan/chitin deacetylase (PgdA/CDA1 family)